jgi:hypothetical protein
MIDAHSTLTARLTSWVYTGHKAVPYDPMPDDQSPDDLDGACPACDHPFGLSKHVCIGGDNRVAV